MTRSAGNPIGHDYRDPAHVECYERLVIRNPDGSTEGRDPRDVPIEMLGELPGPLAAIRAKCIDCCAGSRSEVAKCTAVGCALWPYRTGHNPRRHGIGRAGGNPNLKGRFSEPDESAATLVPEQG